jgi:hypothetical protein
MDVTPSHRVRQPGRSKTLRVELLEGLRFDSLAQAQQLIDLWVEDYNTRRPHQALAMATPVERFQRAADPPLPAEPPLVVAQEPVDAGAMQPRPAGSGEIARLVHSNGVIVVTRQVCSVGRRYAGKQVTVQVEPSLLHVFCEGVYLKTIARTTSGEVTQVRAHRRNNHRPIR